MLYLTVLLAEVCWGFLFFQSSKRASFLSHLSLLSNRPIKWKCSIWDWEFSRCCNSCKICWNRPQQWWSCPHENSSGTAQSLPVCRLLCLFFRGIFEHTIYSFSNYCQSNYAIMIAMPNDWFKSLALAFQPIRIRSKTMTNYRTLYWQLFLCFEQVTSNFKEFWLVHCAVCSCCDWSK